MNNLNNLTNDNNRIEKEIRLITKMIQKIVELQYKNDYILIYF